MIDRRSLLLSGLALGACTHSDLDMQESPVILRADRLYLEPGAPALRDAAVVMRSGRIVAVGDARSLSQTDFAADAVDGTILAGFWNTHVHILTPDLLHAEQRSDAELSATLDGMLTRWGFTTVFDIASILDNTNTIRRRIRSGAVRGPEILTAGEPFFPPDGVPSYIHGFLAEQQLSLPETRTAEDGAARARSQISKGADGVKLFTGSIVGGDIGVLPMPIDMARSIVQVAHAARKPAFAHPSNLEGLAVALDAGVDILAHTAPMAGIWDDKLVRRLVEQRVALIPTLDLFAIEAENFGESPENAAQTMAIAQQQLRAFRQAGGQVLFGTDIGYTERADTIEEFRVLEGAGLTFESTLTALTTAPSERFGFGTRKGRVRRGFDADLVVVDGDPATDMSALSRVRRVYRGGTRIL